MGRPMSNPDNVHHSEGEEGEHRTSDLTASLLLFQNPRSAVYATAAIMYVPGTSYTTEANANNLGNWKMANISL